MGIVPLSSEEVVASSVEALGLDPTIADLETPEVLAESVRRAASFLCPSPPRRIVLSLLHAFEGLCPSGAIDGEAVAEMVAALVAHGDLVEAPVEHDDRGASTRVLFLARPSYVHIRDDALLLLGVRGDGQPLLDEGLAARVEPRQHARALQLNTGEQPRQLLGALGLVELGEDQWLRRPPSMDASDLLARYVEQLRAAGPAGTIEGLRILDPDTRVTYYRGRWRDMRVRDAGAFVARRPQAFGADGWCFAQVENGVVQKLVDLPLLHQLDQAHDEAWRLQAAIDSTDGKPQRVRTSPGAADQTEVHFFSPLPSWAQRRLDTIGQPLGRRRGSMFAYALPTQQVKREIEFLRETMWMTADDDGEDA